MLFHRASALFSLGFVGRLRGLLLARCFDGRLRRLRHGLDLGRRLRVLLRPASCLWLRQRASSFGDLAWDDMFARLRGDGARARVGRGVVIFVVRCACGRGASWVWGARVLNLGARRYRGTVGVDAGACGLGGSRRTWFCWVSCAGNVGGDFWACAALGRQRSAPQRAVGVRKAWLRARGVRARCEPGEGVCAEERERDF